LICWATRSFVSKAVASEIAVVSVGLNHLSFWQDTRQLVVTTNAKRLYLICFIVQSVCFWLEIDPQAEENGPSIGY